MQIEEITVELLKEAADPEIKVLRSRIMQLWDRYYEKQPPVEKEVLVAKYTILRQEMVKRSLPFVTISELDHEVMKRAFLKKQTAKKLTEAEEADLERENELIRENKKSVMFPHKFKAAEWTHGNGHPRCIKCGQEERIGGVCRKPAPPLSKSSEEGREIAKSALAPGDVLDVGMNLDAAAGLTAEPVSVDNVLFVNSLENVKLPAAVMKQAIEVAKKKVVAVLPLGRKVSDRQLVEWKDARAVADMMPEGYEVMSTDDGRWAIATFEKEEIRKPYPNEHACRLVNPATVNVVGSGYQNHEGKRYRVLFAKPKGGDGSVEQAYRYPRETWSAAEARAHCQSHDGAFEAATGPTEKANVEGELMFKITKIDKKQHIVGGIVYEPRTVDTQGDWTDKTEIEQAMYGFMEKYAKDTKRIKVMHKGKANFFPIVEVFQPDQNIKKGDTVVKAGSWWMMVKVTDDEVWDLVEKGELTGFSMGGRASEKKGAAVP